MSDEKIADELLSLATGTKSRTKMGRLRDLFDVIETAMQAGVNRQTIIATLASGGLEMTIPVFDNAMSRIRKNRQTKPNSPPVGAKLGAQRVSKVEAQKVGTEPAKDSPLENSDAKKDLINAIHDEPDLVRLARIAQEARKGKNR